MTRIVAGDAGGQRLRTPAGAATRPTSERVREALFSRLAHLELLDGARVLDLYAGSGALGLEAASRGAGHVLLVDAARSAAQVARDNTRAVGAAVRRAGRELDVAVRAEPVRRVLAGGPPECAAPYDLVFLDPPYDLSEGDLADDLGALVDHGWLAADAVVVVERSARSPQPRWPRGLSAFADRRYGETAVWFADGGDG